jgi:LacI family transcriptional regulator
LCTPSLTTLGGAHVNVGRAAVELLLETADARRRAGAAVQQLVIPSQLVVRASTGSAPARHAQG